MDKKKSLNHIIVIKQMLHDILMSGAFVLQKMNSNYNQRGYMQMPNFIRSNIINALQRIELMAPIDLNPPTKFELLFIKGSVILQRKYYVMLI